MAREPLTIVAVNLGKKSMKSHRVLHDGNPDLYLVMVYLSRAIDEYERKELAAFGIFHDDRNGRCAITMDTTLEQVRDRLDEHNGVLASAVARARETREAAETSGSKR